MPLYTKAHACTVQGRGIFLTRTLDNVPSTENVVAQVYIKKPLLLDGYKFDLRIYVLVTSIRPLRMYLFDDGLVRLATERYVKPTRQNLDHSCMHLTNYAVNKLNVNFHRPEGKGSDDNQYEDSSKRAIQWFMAYVREKYGDAKTSLMWKRIGTLCVRTVLSILPTLSREYDQYFKDFDGIPMKASTSSATENTQMNKDEGNEEEEDEGIGGLGVKDDEGTATEPQLPSERGSRCFEILGLDVMIDQTLRPTLIEVNHLPRYHIHTEIY
jgi:tubulin polyglutamylase TTLL6/13